MSLQRTKATSHKQGALARVFVLAGLSGAMLLGTVGCSGSLDGARNEGPKVDAGGLKQSEIGSLEEEFARVRERDLQMQELLTEAQLQISDEVWGWGQAGVAPILGPNVWALPGMDFENSYHLLMWRWIELPGALGDKKDLQPMESYFSAKGWDTTLKTIDESDYELEADTGEGFLVSWRVKSNGVYNMQVTSGSFWGSGRLLLEEISDRMSPEALGIKQSAPGTYLPFPEWSDPKDNAPKLLDHGLDDK